MKKLLFIAFIAIITIACKKEGCTDQNATNYNADAKKDDGSCMYSSDHSIIGVWELVSAIISYSEGYLDSNGSEVIIYSDSETYPDNQSDYWTQDFLDFKSNTIVSYSYEYQVVNNDTTQSIYMDTINYVKNGNVLILDLDGETAEFTINQITDNDMNFTIAVSELEIDGDTTYFERTNQTGELIRSVLP